MGHAVSAQVVLAYASPTLWYITRATAFSAYIMLMVTVVLGTLRSVARSAGERLTWMTDEVHQFTALMFVLLVAAHLVTLMLDPFLPFSLINILLPVAEPYRPLAVSLGVGAFYTLLAVYGSSLLKWHIPYGAWRGIHYLSFVCFILVSLHGWLAGSDAGEPWMRAVYAGSAAAVVFLVFVRIFTGPSMPPSINKQRR